MPANDAALRLYLNDQMLDLDQPVCVVCNGYEVFQGVVPRQVTVMMQSLAERGDPSYIFPAQIAVVLQAKTQPSSSDNEEKLVQLLPQTYGRYLTRFLDRAEDNGDQVVRALLGTPEAQRSAAFTVLSQLPQEQLRTAGQTALTPQINAMAPVLLQAPDRREQRALAERLIAAGANMPEIVRVRQSSPEQQKKAALLLITNMSQHDLISLSGKFLTENITLA